MISHEPVPNLQTVVAACMLPLLHSVVLVDGVRDALLQVRERRIAKVSHATLHPVDQAVCSEGADLHVAVDQSAWLSELSVKGCI